MNPASIVVPGIIIGILVLISKVVSTGGKAKVSPRPSEEDKEIAKAVEEEIDARDGFLENASSPLDGVSDSQWQNFLLKFSRVAPLGNVSRSNLLGMFAYPYIVLVDMGYCRNLRKVKKGGIEVTTADWVEGYSEAEFLSDASLQYEAYVKWVTWLVAFVKAKLPNSIGAEILGVKASLSGLIAVGQKAGAGALLKWYNGDRKEATNQVFLKGNGHF